MQDSRFLGIITLIFGLLFTLQGVSANQTVSTCDVLNCPKGFRCCDSGCCLERKVWHPKTDTFRLLCIILWVLVLFVFICAFVRHFCHACRELQHDIRSADDQTPPEPPSIAPLESIRVTSWDPPPPYSQVVLEPTLTEPPPPYSLRSKGPAGQMGWNGYATI